MRLSGSLLLVVLLLPAMAATADEAAQTQIAKILMGLNHFPSDKEKQALEAIASDDSQSQAERTIASALKAVQHYPADGDKAKLMAIANDQDVPEAVRQLARITHDLAHKVGADDRKILSGIISK